MKLLVEQVYIYILRYEIEEWSEYLLARIKLESQISLNLDQISWREMRTVDFHYNDIKQLRKLL